MKKDVYGKLVFRIQADGTIESYDNKGKLVIQIKPNKNKKVKYL